METQCLAQAQSATKCLALLVDGDNLAANLAAELIDRVAMLGDAAVRRVYGDWRNNKNGWTKTAAALGFELVQQDRHPPSRNSTDMAIVIAAMDLLYGGSLDGLCLASGDSDFVPIVQRFRAAGLCVYCFGNKNISKSLRKACNESFQLSAPIKAKCATGKGMLDDESRAVLDRIVELHRSELGWTKLSAISVALQRASQSYAKRRWGFATLTKVLRSTGTYELRDRGGQRYVKKIAGQLTEAPTHFRDSTERSAVCATAGKQGHLARELASA